MASSKSKSKPSTEELHKAMLAWATEEMKFQMSAYGSQHNFRLPSEEDFKKLCCRPLTEVWQYVLKHIRRAEHVKEIKGNLAVLHAMKKGKQYKASFKSDVVYDEEKDELEKEKARLMQDLNSINSDVKHLRQEMQHVTQEVMDAELAYQSVSQKVRDLTRKESIMEVACACAAERCAQYAAVTSRITERADAIRMKETKTDDNFVVDREGENDDFMESSVCHSVNEACKDINQFLKSALDGSLPAEKSLEDSTKHLWQSVSQISASHEVSSVVHSLEINTVRAAKRVRERTLEVNIQEDVEALSFSYGQHGSELKDQSSPPTVQKSVGQLLQASNLQHVMRWFKEQEHLNESWKLEARLDSLLGDIHKHVHRVMGEHPRNVPLAKTYVDALLDLAAERSVMPCLRDEVDSLTTSLQAAQARRQELRKKLIRIQDFRKLVDKKQAAIGALARQNSGAPEKLQAQRKKVESYLSAHFVGAQMSELDQLSRGLENSLASEIDRFSMLALPCLLTVPLDSTFRVSVMDLSIAPSIHPAAKEMRKAFGQMCQALGFPDYKSVDKLADHILQLQTDSLQAESSCRQREVSARLAKEASKTSDNMDAVVERVKEKVAELASQQEEHDRHQSQKLVPKLEKVSQVISMHLAEAEVVKTQINDWWTQPAQFTTPWVKVGGLTFDQWMQKWRVIVTEFNRQRLDRTASQKPRK